MKHHWICLMLAAILCLSCFAGCKTDTQQSFEETIGIDLAQKRELTSIDTHQGLHQDGLSLRIFALTKEEIEKIIDEQTHFQKLPLSEPLTILVYGKTTPQTKDGPYFTDENGAPLLDVIDEGYYLFFDRHSDAVSAFDDTQILARASLNCSIAIIDTQSQKLYILELDT